MLTLQNINKLNFVVCLLYALTFSWHLTFSSVLLGVMILLWVLGFVIKGQNSIGSFLRDPKAWILISPFILGVFGLTYSSNMNHGLFILGVAFCMFIQPIIFSSSKWVEFTRKQVASVLLAFVLGSFTAAMYCMSLAVMNYFGGSELGTGEFFYTDLMKVPLSPGAFGNYMNVSIVILLAYLAKELPWCKRYKTWEVISALLLLVFFSYFLMLLQAKTSILALIVCVGLLFVYKLSKWFSRMVATLFVGVSVLGVVLFIQFNGLSLLGERFVEIPTVIKNISKTSETSTALRLSAIYGSVDIIERNPLLGVGTGAVKDELRKFYKREGYQGATRHKTDSHNQFLRTFAKNGVIGFIVLIVAMMLPIVLSFKRDDPLLLLIGVTQFVMAITGDILDNQPGIVFHAFVICFVIYVANPSRFRKGSTHLDA